MLTENQLINKNQRFDVYAADDELRANALNLAVCGIITYLNKKTFSDNHRKKVFKKGKYSKEHNPK